MNRHHTLLRRMLFDIEASDHLAQFVHWRRVKARAIEALMQDGNESPVWAAYQDDVTDGAEHQLLRYLRSGIDAGEAKRRRGALKHLRKIHARRVRNELRKRHDRTPLVGHGVVRTLDALILFYDQLEKTSKSDRPERFANRSSKALDKENIDEFVRIAKKEQVFYGNLAIISRRLGLPESVQDYAAAQQSNTLRRTFERSVLLCLSGLLAASVGTLAITTLYRSPSHVDVLDDDIARYIAEDHLVEDEIETRLEARYGINIVGAYTQGDLIELEERLVASYPPEVIRLLGLRRIVILDDDLRTHVDYAGKAIRSTAEMRLFSGNVSGVVDHEMAHFQTFTHELTQSDLVAQWQEIAGPYDHVEYERSPQERGGGAMDTRYIDGGESYLPRHGYMRAYGGVNYHEDIATFVEAIRSEGLTFSLVTQDFEVYERKLALLRDNHYISEDEFDEAIGMLGIARAGVQTQDQQGIGVSIPDLPEAL